MQALHEAGIVSPNTPPQSSDNTDTSVTPPTPTIATPGLSMSPSGSAPTGGFTPTSGTTLKVVLSF